MPPSYLCSLYIIMAIISCYCAGPDTHLHLPSAGPPPPSPATLPLDGTFQLHKLETLDPLNVDLVQGVDLV